LLNRILRRSLILGGDDRKKEIRVAAMSLKSGPSMTVILAQENFTGGFLSKEEGVKDYSDVDRKVCGNGRGSANAEGIEPAIEERSASMGGKKAKGFAAPGSLTSGNATGTTWLLRTKKTQTCH